MKSRERVLTALKMGIPDTVPFMENCIDESLQIQLMGRNNYTPDELASYLGLDAIGFSLGDGDQTPIDYKDHYYYPPKLTFSFETPFVTEKGEGENGRFFHLKGLMTKENYLDLFEKYLPDPNHQSRYEKVSQWITKHKKDLAVFASIRLGAASTINSMGIEQISYALYDNPCFVKEVHRLFSEWSAQVVENLNKMDFDFFWVADDLADNKGPWFPPAVFRETFLPNIKIVADRIKKPWIFHSDGNIYPILEDLLSLGMNAINPIQPAAMNI